MAGHDAPTDLESREPTLEDLRDLCRALNDRGAGDLVFLRHWFSARGEEPPSIPGGNPGRQ